METDIPLLYALVGLVLAACLLTYLTHEPGNASELDDPAKDKKKKKHKKSKHKEHWENREPYLLNDSAVLLATKRSKILGTGFTASSEEKQ